MYHWGAFLFCVAQVRGQVEKWVSVSLVSQTKECELPAQTAALTDKLRAHGLSD